MCRLASVTGLTVVLISLLAIVAFSSLEFDLQHPPRPHPGSGHHHSGLDNLLLNHGAKDISNAEAAADIVVGNSIHTLPAERSPALKLGHGGPSATRKQPTVLNPALLEVFRPVVEQLRNQSKPADAVTVEVWGKAAIGDYLFRHVLGGWVEPRMGGVWSYGEARCGDLRFTYRTGHGVRPSKVPQSTRNGKLVSVWIY